MKRREEKGREEKRREEKRREEKRREETRREEKRREEKRREEKRRGETYGMQLSFVNWEVLLFVIWFLFEPWILWGENRSDGEPNDWDNENAEGSFFMNFLVFYRARA